MNDQFDEKELSVLTRELLRVLRDDINGEVVELGCYKGLTSIHIQKLLEDKGSLRSLYLYDSFSGLPPKHQKDSSPVGTQFKQGELPANKNDVIKQFKKAGLPVPYIYKTWFKEITPDMLPSKISFAFLDGDFYESIMDSLRCVWPLLSEGSVVLVDDYSNLALPGAAKAVDEWLKTHPASLKVESSLAIIRPI